MTLGQLEKFASVVVVVGGLKESVVLSLVQTQDLSFRFGLGPS